MRDELMSLLEEALPLTEFCSPSFRAFPPSAGPAFLNPEEYRKGYREAKFGALAWYPTPTPSDFVLPGASPDRFPASHLAGLVGVVERLLDRYIDPDSRTFALVVPATWLQEDHQIVNAESFSKSIIRCAALFGVAETVDLVLQLREGKPAEYTQVVVLDGISLSRRQGIELWPGARLAAWDQTFRDPQDGSVLGVPNAVLALRALSIDARVGAIGASTFSFGRNTTLLCIDRSGGPIIRRQEDVTERPTGGIIPTNPHRVPTEIALSALALAVNHPVIEVCSWHWFDVKICALTGYRNELGPDQNLGHSGFVQLPLVNAATAQEVRDIHCGLSRSGVLEKLRVPVQRWRRSKEAGNGVDLAIDLRVALESLFLGDANNAELSFRLALRAAWYLDVEGHDRVAVFDAFRAAYDIGSKAVHTGMGYGDRIPASLADAQDLCRLAILRRIGAGGQTPDWKQVVLGNAPDELHQA